METGEGLKKRTKEMKKKISGSGGGGVGGGGGRGRELSFCEGLD